MRGLRFVCGVVLVGVVFGWGSVGVFAEDDGAWKVELKFEDSEEVRQMPNVDWRTWERPAFVGEVFFKTSRRRQIRELSNAIRGSSLPEEKVSYVLGIQDRISVARIELLRNELNEVSVFSVYGRDRDEVETVAQTLVTKLNDDAFKKYSAVQRELEAHRKTAADLEEEIPELMQERTDLGGKLELMRRRVRYRDAEDAVESMKGFVRMLEGIEVDIVGIKAKLEAAKQQKDRLLHGQDWSPGVADQLVAMRVLQETELAGAMARQEAAQAGLRRATDYFTWTERIKRLPDLVEEKEQELSMTRRRIGTAEKTLAEPGVDFRPVELLQDVVVIRSVVFAEKEEGGATVLVPTERRQRVYLPKENP